MRERHPPTTGAATSITTAEAAAVAALAIPVCAIVSAYLLDQIGLRFVPGLVLPLVVAASAGTFVIVARGTVRVPGDERMLALVVAASTGWLLWLARPTLLPLGTGPDLTHHLILIRYIEEHWRLVHDPALGRVFGEMAQYTPGSHILAALSGSWSGTDGLRALHPLQAFTVALKSGFLFLIGVRLLPPRTPRVLALIGVLLLWAAPRYFLGGFTEYAFVAQVVAELFVVAMWWAAVAWDAEPGWRGCVVFGITGVAAFLTWPVYCGPPALAFFLIVALRTDLPLFARVRHLLAAFAPIASIAAIYLIGRIGLLQIAATGGSAPWPSVSAFGWPLVALAAVGLAVRAVRGRGRSTVLMLVAVVAQTVAFYVLAKRSGSPQPYMAQKMFYLLLWPMAACAVIAVGELWRIGQAMCATTDRAAGPASRFEQIGAWLCVGAVLVLIARPLIRTPRLLHPLPPAVSLPLYEAGRWTRTHVDPACVEYLVSDDETAYWLHLAVLGNPRAGERTGNNATYEPTDALVRWLTPNGLPYAIADLPALPRDVRNELDIVQQFGTAAVVRRRGPSSCIRER